MSEEYDEEAEEMRRRLLEIQRRMEEERRLAEERRRFELQKQAMLWKILTPEARGRLSNLKLVRPELAEQLELELIRLAQIGRLPTPLSEDGLKRILSQISSRRREMRIRMPRRELRGSL